MRKTLSPFWFFCLLLCFMATVEAQELRWQEIPFAELGWENDQKLEGSHPSHTLYFPDFPGINWEQSYLHLEIEVPSVLSPSSSLTVRGDGNLLLTTSLRSGTLSIPLKELSPGKNPHRIDIEPYLFISDNLCEDLNSGNLFCFVKKESRFVLFRQETTIATLTDFLNLPEKRIEIILPTGEWSKDLEKAYMKLYAFLRRSLRNTPLTIETSIAQEGQSLLADHRRIFLQERAQHDFELYGKTLFLTPQGVEALVEKSELMVFPAAQISTVQGPFPSPPRRLYLDELFFRGIGTLTNTFYFPSADLGGIPQQLKLILYLSHSPLKTNFQGDASFTVRLNGESVYTEQLNANPVTVRTPRIVFLPPELLRRENALEFSFSYFPEIGNCRRGEKPLEASISNKSYLEPRGQGYLPPILTFNDVPTFFWGQGFLVLPETPTLSELQIEAIILATLRSIDRRPIDITVVTPKEAKILLSQPSYQSRLWQKPFQPFVLFQKECSRYAQFLETQNLPSFHKLVAFLRFAMEHYSRAMGETISFFFIPFSEEESRVLRDYFIAVAPSANFPSSPLISEGKDLVLKDTFEGKTIMRFGPNESLGILTTFWENGHPVILFTTHGEFDQATRHFFNTFKEEKTLRRLIGNVTLFSKNGFTSVLSGPPVSPPKPAMFVFQEWFLRFRIFLFLVIVSIIILASGLLYNRLVRSKNP
ncbi:MAG: cellulose biosynthesis cyclic di-GMP-binding regulatory protein BcsB [Atribacterota bacterium]